MDAVDELVADVEQAESRLRLEDNQCNRRTLIRSQFALIELMFFNLRTTTMELLVEEARYSGKLNVFHICLLSEESPVLSDKGEVVTQQQRQPFLNHLAFTIRTLADFVRLDVAPKFGDNGWNELRRETQVRHRLTHPKSPQDIIVTDDEIRTMQRADNWLQEVHRELMEAIASLRRTGVQYCFGERVNPAQEEKRG
jgi:hypothetical protein